MNTNQIILECSRGSESAFRALVNEYSDLAFSVAFRIVNDEDEAKDITQESFISIWKNIGRFDPSRSFKSWLYKIVANKCLDVLRKKKKVKVIYPDETNWVGVSLQAEGNPEERLSNKELGQLILVLTENLSPKQKMVFVLSELEGLSHDEIAEATGMNKDSIKSNLNHARRNVAGRIQKHI